MIYLKLKVLWMQISRLNTSFGGRAGPGREIACPGGEVTGPGGEIPGLGGEIPGSDEAYLGKEEE